MDSIDLNYWNNYQGVFLLNKKEKESKNKNKRKNNKHNQAKVDSSKSDSTSSIIDSKSNGGDGDDMKEIVNDEFGAAISNRSAYNLNLN